LFRVDDEDLVAVRESHLRDGSFRGVSAHVGSVLSCKHHHRHENPSPPQHRETHTLKPPLVQHTHRMF
jgi:hypothetical protein